MLAHHNDPIIAIATAPGRGAVGIVRLSGKQLAAFTKALCGRDLTPRVATYLALNDKNATPIDQVLALYFQAPHSYTGEDVLELQAHGGPVVLQMIVARCFEVAAAIPVAEINKTSGNKQPTLPYLRLAKPGEFTERAYLNHKLDLAQAEAVADLIDASTEAAARGASRSLAGAFSQEVEQLRSALIHLRTLVEATLDFPEEEIDFLQQADARGQLSRLQDKLVQVIKKTQQGALLREGVRVVIAGQPNAGKSSLLNALAGVELAIVTPIAGTTRDAVQQTIQIDGVPVHVVDTAGLRERQEADEVERIGIDRAWRHIEGADAVLFVHDVLRKDESAYQAADAEIEKTLSTNLAKRIPVVHVWNKSDALPDVVAKEGVSTDVQNISTQHPATTDLHISAKTGWGLDALRQALLRIAGWQGGASEGLYMARARHVQALEQAQAHFDLATAHLLQEAPALDVLAEELRLAQNALNAITGEFSSDDLLGEIFSSFCIGK
ncbi:MAG: tRNA uridine-5-carboxymethylaminomethyl(34) synthesis GTPase MnmE [Pseudomonadota bacterium]